jgi:hypothetical protein
MNSKEFDVGLQVEIEISGKVPKSLMRHLPPLHLTRFPGPGRGRGRQAVGKCVINRAYSGFFEALYQKFFLKMDFNLYKMRPVEWQPAVCKWAAKGRPVRYLYSPMFLRNPKFSHL